MSKASFARPTSILASLFLAAILGGGCAGAADGGGEEDDFDAEVAQTDDGDVAESEEALKYTMTSSGGSTDPTNGCGWFCPWWAKDLSDCIIKICNNDPSGGGVYAP